MERIKFFLFIFIFFIFFEEPSHSKENLNIYENFKINDPGLFKNEDQYYKNVKKYFEYWCKNYGKKNQIISVYDKNFCSKDSNYGIDSLHIEFLNNWDLDNFLRKIDHNSIENTKLLSKVIPYSFKVPSNPSYDIYDFISFYMDDKNPFRNLKILSDLTKCKRGSYNNCYGKKKISGTTYEGEWKNGCLNGSGKTKTGNYITFGNHSCGLLKGRGVVMYEETVDGKLKKNIMMTSFNNGNASFGEYYNYDNEKFRAGNIINGMLNGNLITIGITDKFTVNIIFEEYKNNKNVGMASYKSYDFNNKEFETMLTSYFYGTQSGVRLFFNESNYIVSEVIAGFVTGKAIVRNNKEIFKGEYANNVKEGLGIQNTKYDSWSGNFSQDKRHGVGVINDYEDKSSSKGMFFYGKKNGWFLTCESSGNIYYTYFKDDKITSPKEKNYKKLSVIADNHQAIIASYKENIIEVKRKLKKLFYYNGPINELCDFSFRVNVKEYIEDEGIADNKFILDIMNSSNFHYRLNESIKRTK